MGAAGSRRPKLQAAPVDLSSTRLALRSRTVLINKSVFTIVESSGSPLTVAIEVVLVKLSEEDGKNQSGPGHPLDCSLPGA
jgi:hypothetical protein